MLSTPAPRRFSPRKYLVTLRISFINTLQYRANLPISILFYCLFLYVFTRLWGSIYADTTFQGLTYTQMIWYLCITELVAYGARSSVFAQMNEDIKSGAIAYQLGRPYNYILYQLSSALGGMLFNLAVFSVLAVVVGLLAVGPLPGFTPLALLMTALSVMLGVLIQFFLHMALGLTAFRLEENTGIYLVYQKLVFMMGTFIPIEFLPGWLQGIAKVLPFAYVSWAPAKLAVSFSPALCLQLLPVQALYLLISILIALGAYRLGMRGVQANGG